MSAPRSWSGRGSQTLRRISASPRAPLVGLAIAIAAFFAVNLWARHSNYFFYDEYEIVLHRYSLHDLLEPTNGHPMIMWLPLYYLMRPIFGLDSAIPYELLGMLAMAGAGCVIFAYLSARAGRWIGLVGAVLILFIGSGSDVLFWSFQLAFAGSVAAGVGALLVLTGERRHRDAIAALLLIASVFFLAVGLAFVVAAVAAVIVTTGVARRRAALVRLALVVGPALFLYAIWYLAFGHDSPNRSSFDNLISTPGFALEGVGASLAFLAGLAGDPSKPTAIAWGIVLLVGAGALAAWRVVAGPRISSLVWVGLAGGIAFWVLTGINRPAGTGAEAGRYCFVGGVFALLVLAELVRGLRLTRVAAGLGLALALVSVVGNLAGTRYGREALRPQAEILEADLGALDIARDRVDPAFLLTPEISGSGYLIVVDAGSYFKSKDRYGSPALSPEELLAQPEPMRADADSVLVAALPVSLTPGALPPGLACRRLVADEGVIGFSSGPGRAWLRAEPGAPATVEVTRFGGTPRPLGTIEAGSAAELTIPADGSTQPWQVRVAAGRAEVCGT